MISVICPVYNEEKNIENVLDFFVKSKPAEKELLIIDGGSTDNTKAIVNHWIEKNSNIFIIDNPQKTVPFALNIGLKHCRGEIISRIDAHTIYADDYFEKILETFGRTDADIVGGPTRIHAVSAKQEAIGYVMSHPFGIGGSKVHDVNYNGYSDHVTFGAWKREIFSETGVFDERLVRNQDDEFHYRARSMGKKIYLSSNIKLWYQPRESIKKFFKQYFQYGCYKPIVLAKIKSEAKIRHLIPSIFTIYLLLLIPAAVVISPISIIFIFIYYLVILYIVFKSKITKKYYLLILFPVIHTAYGIGFLSGIIKAIGADKFDG